MRSVSGGMIVGRKSSDICIDFDEDEYGDNSAYLEEEHDMSCLSPDYDCDECDIVIGFYISDCMVDDITSDQEWILDLNEKADKFFKITGSKAKLIGAQNIR
jgi:hypothetical protein